MAKNRAKKTTNSVKKNKPVESLISDLFPSGTLDKEAKGDLKELNVRLKSDRECFPLWPPDLFALSAYLAETTGAYTIWAPTLKSYNEKSKNAEQVGRHWHKNEFWAQDYAEYKRYKPDELDKFIYSDDPVEQHLGYFYYVQSRWESLCNEFAGYNFRRANPTESNFKKFTILLMELLIVADEASAHIATQKDFIRDEDEVDENLDSDLSGWGQLEFEFGLITQEKFLTERSKQVFKDTQYVFDTLTKQYNDSYGTVLPKMRTPQVGATLRAFSHYLCILPAAREVITYSILNDCSSVFDSNSFNILAIPYPYKIRDRSFIRHDLVEKNDCHWGEFSIQPEWLEEDFNGSKENFFKFVKDLIASSEEEIDAPVHAVVLPELAITPEIFEYLGDQFARNLNSKLELIVSGICESSNSGTGESNDDLDRRITNSVGITSYTGDTTDKNGDSIRLFNMVYQPKHHRWKLDREQLSAYGLLRRFSGKDSWWEKKSVTQNREVAFVPFRHDGWISCLVCEDLARIDPCQPSIRAVGPNLIFAVLMDGPQLKHRWPARYATVFSDDPGSSVLTLTSTGLLVRNQQFSKFDPSDVIGLWQDSINGTSEIVLKPGDQGVVLSIEFGHAEEFTIDGRSDQRMSEVYSLIQQTSVGTKKGISSPKYERYDRR